VPKGIQRNEGNMAHVPEVTLASGIKMPLLGLGVYQIRDLNECEQAVYEAIMAGYRLIDTASAYGNEAGVGKAIKRSGVPREELFITTKVWVKDVSYEGTKAAFKVSLEKLQLDFLDLYLIHQPYNDIYGAWRAMQELYEAGQAKAIGVSNFDSARLVDLILNNKIAPMVNQVEIHPFNQQTEAIRIMHEHNVQPEGWAPFAEGRQDLFTNKVLAEIGEKYNKSAAQVVLRWNIQREVVAIPKSVRKERIIENFDIFDFELTDPDMGKILQLDESRKLFVNHDDPEFVKMLHNR
jgi:2,5-diketo-D-gluconate reductase A